jgi:nucleolar protein 15
MVKRKFQVEDLVTLDSTKSAEEVQKTAIKRVKKEKAAGRKVDEKRKQKKPGVLHVKQLPRVLDEQDLKEYFQQFGRVDKVKLARSSRTANSKGYAFILFRDGKVAEVAAKSMDKYLLFNCLLKCKAITNEEYVKFDDIFKVTYKGREEAVRKIGANNKIRLLETSGKAKNRERNTHRAESAQTKKDELMKKKLEAAGIEL